jgi:hypothetical protein
VARRYTTILSLARRTIASHKNTGWSWAELTFEGVERLKAPPHSLTQGAACQRLAEDIGSAEFSPTSARRYHELWQRYGPDDSRERNGAGTELTFGEHYAIIRGGAPARQIMEEARAAGRGPYSAVLQRWAGQTSAPAELGRQSTRLLDMMISAEKALIAVVEHFDENDSVADVLTLREFVVEAQELLQRLSKNLDAANTSRPGQIPGGFLAPGEAPAS